MPKVVIYGTRFCAYCIRARMLLNDKGVDYQDILIDQDAALRHKVYQMSGRSTVPQIWIDDVHIGGFSELYALQREGRLNQLLQLET